MRRLRLYILLFGVALALPLGYLVLRTHHSLEREEEAELRFFAETLFDAMEQELALFVRMEELRPIDAYTTPHGPGGQTGSFGASAARDGNMGIVGYLQNNPDGSFLAWTEQEGLFAGDVWLPGGVDPGASRRLVALEEVNRRFNAVRKETVPAFEGPALDRQPPHGEGPFAFEQAPPPIILEEPGAKPFGFEAGMASSSGEKKFVEKNLPPDPPRAGSPPAPRKSDQQADEQGTVADRYLDQRARKLQAKLGESKSRVERLTPQQMLNLDPFLLRDENKRNEVSKALEEISKSEAARDDDADTERREAGEPVPSAAVEAQNEDTMRYSLSNGDRRGMTEESESAPVPEEETYEYAYNEGVYPRGALVEGVESPAEYPVSLQAEVDPMQSLLVGKEWIYLFRRIVIERRIYRQGLVIDAVPFLEHMLREHFSGQPMARFARLELAVVDPGAAGVPEGGALAKVVAGAKVDGPMGSMRRSFARPFPFLTATLTWDELPPSPARNTLALVSGVLALIMLAGLYAIYRSARVAHEHSERRTGFVSAVTHELKTPLTNIRLYVEMLEQGMASDSQRRARYFRILDSETGRLSRLIQNVLEFSKLERRQRRLNLQEGDLVACAREAVLLMQEKMTQEGFILHFEADAVVDARFDREAMLQVLLNLLENSVKFGKETEEKEITLRIRKQGRQVRLEVSDTGPGITRQALRKVFDDFYREDNSLTRKTQGTGIGLALVRRFVEAMGGEVMARNNQGAGCTIVVTLQGVEAKPQT